MGTPENFLLSKEAKLIKALGEEEYWNEKVYFPNEVAEFMREYAELQKAEILNNLGLKLDGKVF